MAAGGVDELPPATGGAEVGKTLGQHVLPPLSETGTAFPAAEEPPAAV